MTLSIRTAASSDADAVSRICLLTGDAGKSAQHLHDFPELPGFRFAVPYVNGELPGTWGFVLVDEDKNEVVGYIVGAKDTLAYERYAEAHWWPMLAERYPPSRAEKSADERYMEFFRNPQHTPEASLALASAHMHINILAPYQRQGWGRKLVETAVAYLKAHGTRSVGLGLDARNLDARKFYERLGFTVVEGTAGDRMNLKF
ncbi:acyl-CoA N-acyltransferase [Fistulina hepatica ATCC 64428]|nr:acyl-CoA N-acyltransferase [Fistulina hepatica ATCC 64428]